MQKFCTWETGYKIPKIDCIKLRCKNFASGKLDTKYLKLTASSYSLSQTAITALGGKRKAQERKRKVFALSVPTTAVFLSGTVGLSLEWLWEVKKEKERKEKKKQDFYM